MFHLLQVDTTVVATVRSYGAIMTNSVTMVVTLILCAVLMGILVMLHQRRAVRRYSRMTTSKMLSGGAVAQRLLRDHGIYNVRVKRVSGDKESCFNPRTMTVNLNDDVYDICSIMAIATAAHECGCAVQYVTGYRPAYMRLRLLPVMQYAAYLVGPVILAGVVLMLFSEGLVLSWVGIILQLLAVLLAVLMLRVELNAVKRAVAWFEDCGELTADDLDNVNEALRWSARRHLIDATSALMQFIFSIALIRSRK